MNNSTPTKQPWTPGPWLLSQSGYANAPFVLHVGTVKPNYDRRYPLQGVDWLAELRDDESPRKPEFEANAKLMQLAPEMAEALTKLVESCIAYGTVTQLPISHETRRRADQSLGLAISKAHDLLKSMGAL